MIILKQFLYRLNDGRRTYDKQKYLGNQFLKFIIITFVLFFCSCSNKVKLRDVYKIESSAVIFLEVENKLQIGPKIEVFNILKSKKNELVDNINISKKTIYSENFNNIGNLKFENAKGELIILNILRNDGKIILKFEKDYFLCEFDIFQFCQKNTVNDKFNQQQLTRIDFELMATAFGLDEGLYSIQNNSFGEFLNSLNRVQLVTGESLIFYGEIFFFQNNLKVLTLRIYLDSEDNSVVYNYEGKYYSGNLNLKKYFGK